MPKKQVAPITVPTERDQLILNLQAVREEIQPYILMAGIQLTEFNAPLRAIEKQTLEQIRELMSICSELRDGPVHKVVVIWRLREPSYWEQLRLLGQDNTREQKLLKAELKFLRIAWRHRNEQAKEKSAALADSRPKNADGLSV